MSSVAVLGAGNGGLAAAADLTLRGHRVRLFSRSERALGPIREAGGLTLEGAAGAGTAMPEQVTTDIEAAVTGADLVMLVVPATAIDAYAALLAPCLRSGQPLFLNPGGTGGALALHAGLRAAGFAGELRIGEVSTLTYACRVTAPAAVRISNVAPRLPFAAFPGRHVDDLCALVRTVYPAVVPCPSVLETGLANLNAVEHPPQALLNTGWIEHTRGDFYFYHDGTTPSVGRVIDEVDRERLALAAALGVRAQPFVEAFRDAGYTTAEAAATGSSYIAMQHSEANRWFRSPPSIDHRYVHEDVGHGLVPWAAWARLAGVHTPVIDSLVTLAGAATGRDYRSTGLSIERMGLAGLGSASLPRFLESGPVEVPAR